MSAIEDQYVWDISIVLDNEERTSNYVRETVNALLRTGSGYDDMTPDTYEDVRANRSWELFGVAGLAVEEVLHDIADEEASGTAQMLLKQLFSNLTERLGEKYLPMPDDYRDWYEAQDEL